MNDENWYQQSDESGLPPEAGGPPPKQGMSTGMKVFVGIAVFVGIMVMLCCGGLFYFGSKLADMETTDPARIQGIREEVAGIDVPDGWEPQYGFDGELVVFDVKMVIYNRGETRGDTVLAMIMLRIQFSDEAPDQQTASQMQLQLHQILQQQGYSTDLDVESSEERTLMVAGEEATFDFVKGTTPEGTEVRQVTGTFPGRGGPAMLLYQVPEDEWDEDQVVQMIESIQN